jgi:uncharacterized membrane protein
MKSIWMVINNAYVFFGCTLYAGVLWALRFFWYPTWEVYTAGNYYDHFIPPTTAATHFFTIVVPLMFMCHLIMIRSEWHTSMRWLSVAAMLCLVVSTFVGQMYIIPINHTLATHIADNNEVSRLLKEWMSLNDIRFIFMTLAWLLMMYYFGSKAYYWDTHHEH